MIESRTDIFTCIRYNCKTLTTSQVKSNMNLLCEAISLLEIQNASIEDVKNKKKNKKESSCQIYKK